MVSEPHRHPAHLPDDEGGPNSLHFPISMMERFIAQMRRVRWMVLAIAVAVSVLLVSGRIDLSRGGLHLHLSCG
jgi:hypothetical protein